MSVFLTYATLKILFTLHLQLQYIFSLFCLFAILRLCVGTKSVKGFSWQWQMKKLPILPTWLANKKARRRRLTSSFVAYLLIYLLAHADTESDYRYVHN